MKDERTFWLYRLYDADDRLLYIGCTNVPEARIGQHQDPLYSTTLLRQELRHRLDHWTLESAGGKSEAFAAEKAAIQAEAPLFNVLHNKGRHKAVLAALTRTQAGAA